MKEKLKSNKGVSLMCNKGFPLMNNKGISLMNNKGISLIEIMVVITIFSILAILSTQGVLLTLRGSKKSDAVSSVRQNLDFSFAVMERLLRNADSVSCPTTTQVNFVDKRTISGSFSCQNVGSDGYIASGSARLTNEKVNVTACQFTCEAATGGVPPAINISATGVASETTGTEEASVSISTKIFLRTY